MRVGYCLSFMGMVFLVAACGSPELDNYYPPRNGAGTSASLSAASDVSVPDEDFQAAAPKLVTPSNHGGGYGWEKERCFLCHSASELKEIHAYSPSLAVSLSKLGENDTGFCLYCHGTNGLAGVTAESYQCMRCHTNSTIVESAAMFTGKKLHDMNADGMLQNADCVVCHAFSDMNGKLDLAVDFSQGALEYTDVTSFCLNCHDGNGAFGIMPFALTIETDMHNIYSTYNGVGETALERMQTADIHGVQNGSVQRFAELRGDYAESTEVACLDCHQVHSSDNPYLIIESGASATLTDDIAKAAAVEVTEENFTQLCAVCHVSADGAPTDNGLTEVVHPSTYSAVCTDCHYHGAGFGAETSGLF